MLPSLTQLRISADPKADELVTTIVNIYGKEALHKLMGKLTDVKFTAFEEYPEILGFSDQNDLNLNLSDKKQIVRACDFYSKNQEDIGLILAMYSLPYCYLAADGAKVLAFIGRIKEQAFQRLKETGGFLNEVLNYDNWQSGKIKLICSKIRLLHASVRYLIHNSGKWDSQWGEPVNQEDMLGTNLAFSYIVLLGLEKLKKPADSTQTKAYMFTWQKIGELLGVDHISSVSDFQTARIIDIEISNRQFRPSAEGKALTEALLNCIDSQIQNPTLSKILPAYVVFFLGEKHAGFLNVFQTKEQKNLFSIYSKGQRIAQLIFR